MVSPHAVPMDETDQSPTPSRRRPREIRVPPPQVHYVVSEIHQALTTKQRLAVLCQVQEVVAEDSSLVPWLVEAGVWDALILQLRFALHRHGTSVREIEEICHVLDLVLASSPQDIQQSAPLNDDTLDLLLRSTRWSEGARHSILSLWHISSSTETGSRHILESRRILLWISENVFRQSENEQTLLSNALGIIKNVTYFAQDAWDYLFEVAGFLQSILAVSCFGGLAQKDRERLSAVWRNLAVIQENRGRLARNPGVLNGLHTLATSQPQYGATGNGACRNVLNTLISLSMDSESCHALLMHGDGLFSRLMHGLLSSTDGTIRKRAARTVRLWASHETSGALLVHCPALMERVSSVALRDDCQDVRHEAAEAFGRCAGWIRAPMPQQDSVLDALASLCRTSSPSLVARALKGQAAHPNNRLLLMERPIFVETLTAIALEPTNPPHAREDACCALADIAEETRTREKMATPELFQALCSNMAVPSRRDFAVRALVFLAQEEQNIPKMLRFPTLLQSLIQYAATAESSMKGPAKHAILLLVSKI